MHQLVGAGFEDDAQDRFEPVERPFLAKRCRDSFVEPLAFGRDAAHDLGKQRLVSLAVQVPVDLAAEPVQTNSRTTLSAPRPGFISS